MKLESSDRAVGNLKIQRVGDNFGGQNLLPPVEIGLTDLAKYGTTLHFLSYSSVIRDKFANVCTFQPFSNSRHCSSVYTLKIGIFFGKHELVDTLWPISFMRPYKKGQ